MDRLRTWHGRFILPIHDEDLDLLTVWILHTHYLEPCMIRTTPRLLVDSPLPASGKTTVLEHGNKFGYRGLQAATITSDALLARCLENGLRTILIDEAEKSLRPDRPVTKDLLAMVNSGYKRGGTRPVLVPTKSGSYEVKEMPSFAPVAMAGISPDLPGDTLSRSIRMLILPDRDGVVEPSDWEFIDEEADDLLREIESAVAESMQAVREHNRPELPEGIRGRMAEKWRPLKRIADVAGGRWPDAVDSLAVRELRIMTEDQEQEIHPEDRGLVLIRHMVIRWPRSAGDGAGKRSGRPSTLSGISRTRTPTIGARRCTTPRDSRPRGSDGPSASSGEYGHPERSPWSTGHAATCGSRYVTSPPGSGPWTWMIS